MSMEAIEILHKCRLELQACASAPLNIKEFRDELSSECNVAVDLLKELKKAEAREIELDGTCAAVQNHPN